MSLHENSFPRVVRIRVWRDLGDTTQERHSSMNTSVCSATQILVFAAILAGAERCAAVPLPATQGAGGRRRGRQNWPHERGGRHLEMTAIPYIPWDHSDEAVPAFLMIRSSSQRADPPPRGHRRARRLGLRLTHSSGASVLPRTLAKMCSNGLAYSASCTRGLITQRCGAARETC